MDKQKILQLLNINTLVAALGVTAVLICYIAWAWMTWVIYMWELFVIVGSVLIVVTFLVLCGTVGLWSFLVRKFVPVMHSVARFLSVYLLYCLTRILLGYLLYLAVYQPIVDNLHPFRNIGPTWSSWSKFWYQVSLWVTPYVLYTFVLLPLPVIFIFVSTYFQQRRFNSFLLEQGGTATLKKFLVNGMTNVISVTLFETLLTFGFMLALIAYDIVPDRVSMGTSSSSGGFSSSSMPRIHNAPDAAGGSFMAYLAYVVLVLLQSLFSLLANSITNLWLLWLTVGCRFSEEGKVQGVLGNGLSLAREEPQNGWARLELKNLMWTAVDSRAGRVRVGVLAAGWQLGSSLVVRSLWIFLYYWAYAEYVWVGYFGAALCFLLSVPVLFPSWFQLKKVAQWWRSEEEEGGLESGALRQENYDSI